MYEHFPERARGPEPWSAEPDRDWDLVDTGTWESFPASADPAAIARRGFADRFADPSPVPNFPAARRRARARMGAVALALVGLGAGLVAWRFSARVAPAAVLAAE